jgi:eukaryotic-like serine/threonine-protein kinase
VQLTPLHTRSGILVSGVKLDDFLLTVRRSGLVPFHHLAGFCARLGGDISGSPVTAVRLGQRLVEENLLTSWQLEKLMEGRHEGFMVGEYRLRDHIDNGAIAAVFEAEHVRTGERVALKILLPHLAHKTSFLERFKREARAAQQLRHANIVQVRQVGCEDYPTTGPLHYMVTEFSAGKNLERLVHDHGPLSPDFAGEFIRQAAKGLAHAHAQGIIHRNLKPNNLLMDDGLVKVSNLGVARFLNEDDSESLTLRYQEKVIGTAAFMAPEQVLNSHEVDSRSDLYSLGCILYYLLTGKPPFAGSEGMQLMLRQMHEKPVPLSEVRPDVPAKLAAVCERLLSKRPEERYSSANDLAGVLSDWLLSTTISWARKRSRPQQTARPQTAGAQTGDAVDVLAEDMAQVDSKTIANQGDETLDDVPRLPRETGVPKAAPINLWAALPPGDGEPVDGGSSIFDDLMKTMADLTGKKI